MLITTQVQPLRKRKIPTKWQRPTGPLHISQGFRESAPIRCVFEYGGNMSHDSCPIARNIEVAKGVLDANPGNAFSPEVVAKKSNNLRFQRWL